ncbi:MAG: toxin-antitoxin system HicB family antitoxin [Treponema sp.]|nr:toxin-antitoxin system HicB family antitoxin [Treponema sp.]
MAVKFAPTEEKTSVLTIRVPHQLKERIEFAAEQQGVSINQFALYAFTKQLSELEDSAYYQQFIRNKTRQDLLAGFDAAMNKVQYRIPSEEDGWDALKVAEPDMLSEFGKEFQKKK